MFLDDMEGWLAPFPTERGVHGCCRHMDSLMEDIMSIDSAFMPPPSGYALSGRQVDLCTVVEECLSMLV